MDDQLDNDLKNRIRDVFENYEDEHADEGWLLLRKKYPEKAKRLAVAWLWWGSVAALLLLFVGIWWMNNKPEIKQNLASNKKQPINYQAHKVTGTEKDSGKATNAAADSVINSLQNQNLATNTTHADHLLKHNQVKTNEQLSLPVSTSTNQKEAKADYQNVIANNYIPKNDRKANEITTTNQSKSPDQEIAANKIDNADKIDDNIKTDINIKPAIKSSTIVAVKPGVNMQEEVKKANKLPFSDDNFVGNKKPEKAKNANKAVDFGVYAATYFNYAKGSSSQLNVGAGVTSDIKLSRNLNLSTGVTIAQNTLSYGNQLPPDNNARLNAAAVAPAAATVAASYLAASGQNIYSAVTPSLKNYNASLVGLDVPVNLKYEFNPEKSPTYISIGLSSGTFINETYTSTYNYSLPFAANVSSTSDQSVHQSFNSFYFAKTLNFSFGTGYSLGRNQLIIEPFLKYPLDGLGSEQIKFGAGGVNLKFNFQARKK